MATNGEGVQGVVRDPIHVVTYGDSGAGKSTFASTFPKPMLVLAFDPFSKERPYLKRGMAEAVSTDPFGTPIRQVRGARTEKLLIQVEYYLDADPTRPEAYNRFLTRMSVLAQEYELWRTIVLDSVTFMDIAARKFHQYYLNPNAKDPRQWYAGATEQLEEMLMVRFGSLPMNVVVVAHVDEDKDEVHGAYVRNPAAPGRMRKRLAAGYGELYHARVRRDDGGQRIYELQTRTDMQYQAASQIDAPDPCMPVYESLWQTARTAAA